MVWVERGEQNIGHVGNADGPIVLTLEPLFLQIILWMMQLKLV
jgi:hypothetical protein